MNGFAIVLGALLFVAGVLLLVLILNLIERRAAKPRPLKPHFLRLGQIAPDDACPCKQGKASSRTYAQCCRPGDIKKLERDIREFLWRRWARRSYGGRRRMKTLRQRLEEFPVPDVVFPAWVTHPEDHVFPVSETLLRAWRPDRGQQFDLREPPFEDTMMDDII